MDLGEQVRTIRIYKGMSQKQLADRTGLAPPYISRMENGHMTPSLETLSRFAAALEVKLYQLLYDGEAPPEIPTPIGRNKSGCSQREISFIRKMRRALLKASNADKEIILYAASKMVNSRKKSPINRSN
jgi:transcriptional regulator with XRE-family HTH domain